MAGSKSKTNTLSEYTQELNPQGYINNREITNLPGKFLVPPSRNVIIKNSEKVVTRPGASLVGSPKTMNSGTEASYDWANSSRDLLSVKLISKQLEVFYNNAYVAFKTALASRSMEFAEWWDPNELIDVLLMVDGTAAVKEWSGAIADIASVTADTITIKGYTSGIDYEFDDNGSDPDTITKVGGGLILAGFEPGDVVVVQGSASNDGTYTVESVTDTVLTLSSSDALTSEAPSASVILKRQHGSIAEMRFFTTGTRGLFINGIEYSYTGGENAGTFTGVSPSPVGAAFAGDTAFQAVRQFTPDELSTLLPDQIGVFTNYIFYGSSRSQKVIMSKSTDFTDFSFTASGRLPGEGFEFNFDSCPSGFQPGESDMYVHAAPDDIYHLVFTLSGAGETISIKKKSAPGQAAIAQSAIFNTPEGGMFVAGDHTVDSIAHVASVAIDISRVIPVSDPIKDDMEAYDTAGAHGLYFKRNLYIMLPNEQTLIIRDMQHNYWQAPMDALYSRLAIMRIDGVDQLCGHSATTDETFLLADQTKKNDNGIQFKPVAAFGYENYGTRFQSKVADEFWSELYVTKSTVVKDLVLFDYKGATAVREGTIDPEDPANALNIFEPATPASIGESILGNVPLGSSTDEIPNKIKMKYGWGTTVIDFFERQRIFYSLSPDPYFEILVYGENAEMSDNQSIGLIH